MFFTHLFVSLHCISLQDVAFLRKMDGKMSLKFCMSAWREECCKNAGFAGFCSEKGCFLGKNDEKMQIFQKKTRKCFVVRKKALPLHSLYNGNSATNDDRLFSSVGQSTWFVISGSLVRIRQEAQIKRMRISLWSCRKCVFWNGDKVRANSRVAKWGRL